MSKAIGLALVSILAVVLLVGSGDLPVSASASTKFDTVQVFIQTSQDLPYSYTLAAYNTAGFQVAYYQSSFAAASLELPDGTYLFTVQASYSPANYPCVGCVPGPIVPVETNAITNSTPGANSTGVTVVPIFHLSSSNEYGYSIKQITGPSSFTINTQNASALPTTQVTVHVAYANGTAAQGAWVYASIVDDNYYYGPSGISGVQTRTNGTAVLTVPQAPLLVTSDLSVPITLPKPQSNVTVTVGGQAVNVTLYWQPNSITLEGQILILPPQTSGSITLQYQQQQYAYPISRGSSTAPGVPGTTTTQTVTASINTTSQNASQARIPPFNPSSGQAATLVNLTTVTKTVTAKGLGEESLLLIGGLATIAVVLAALILVPVTVRGKRKPNIVSA